MKQPLVSVASRPSSVAPARAPAWQDELLEAVKETYAPRIGHLPEEAIARALHAAYEATVLRGLRDRNAAQIRSFRRRFEEALGAISESPVKVGTDALPNTVQCGAAPAACTTERPAGRRRVGRRLRR
jgi:hypothetical protein